jgi:hypothetical protein
MAEFYSNKGTKLGARNYDEPPHPTSIESNGSEVKSRRQPQSQLIDCIMPTIPLFLVPTKDLVYRYLSKNMDYEDARPSMPTVSGTNRGGITLITSFT